MVKMVAGALIGLLIIILGIYVWYVYMTTFMTEGNHILFALSMVQIGIGIYILFRASNSGEKPMQTNEYGMPIVQNDTAKGGILARNNRLMEEWEKNVTFRDKMKILKEAAKETEKQPFSS